MGWLGCPSWLGLCCELAFNPSRGGMDTPCHSLDMPYSARCSCHKKQKLSCNKHTEPSSPWKPLKLGPVNASTWHNSPPRGALLRACPTDVSSYPTAGPGLGTSSSRAKLKALAEGIHRISENISGPTSTQEVTILLLVRGRHTSPGRPGTPGFIFMFYYSLEKCVFPFFHEGVHVWPCSRV